MPFTFHQASLFSKTAGVNPRKRISTGFSGQSEDYLEQDLNLHHYCVTHPAATFFMRAEGRAMVGVGIFDGDILVVDRSLTPKEDAIVVAVVHGELTARRLAHRGRVSWLLPANHNFTPLQITDDMGFEVWGVVTHVVHKIHAS